TLCDCGTNAARAARHECDLSFQFLCHCPSPFTLSHAELPGSAKPWSPRTPHQMPSVTSRPIFERYFVKLGAMLHRHGRGNGITTSSLFRGGCRGGKSKRGSTAKAEHVATFVESPDSRS